MHGGSGLPVAEKRHSFEYLRTIAHLRPRTNTFGCLPRAFLAAQAIHNFFQERGFIYIHTPIITASDCEGAGALFRSPPSTRPPPRDEEGEVDYGKDFLASGPS